MKFVLDENVPRNMCKVLKKRGYECKNLVELQKVGFMNGDIARFAVETQMIIITCDADFLILGKEIQSQARVIYFKVHPRDPKILVELLERHVDSCLSLLNDPGKVIITKEGCSFKKPMQK